MNRRVVVTGMGAVTPLGIGAGKLHAAAVRGESGIIDGIGRCTEFDGSKMPSQYALRTPQDVGQTGELTATGSNGEQYRLSSVLSH
jgi:3-oxoacyl-[acyl-carrier-protein] synthase II